jgi:hypothetical protein
MIISTKMLKKMVVSKDAVVRVSQVSYQIFFQCTHKIQFIAFLQSQNTIHCFFAVTKYNAFLLNNLTKRRFCSLKTH